MMLMARPASRFRPAATYDRDGDCIEFLVKPDSFYAERIDDLVTVYYSQESNEVIGSLIKGITKLLNDLPGLKIVVQDRKVKLEYLLLAHLLSSKKVMADMATLTYRKLIDVAEESEVEAELAMA